MSLTPESIEKTDELGAPVAQCSQSVKVGEGVYQRGHELIWLPPASWVFMTSSQGLSSLIDHV